MILTVLAVAMATFQPGFWLSSQMTSTSMGESGTSDMGETESVR